MGVPKLFRWLSVKYPQIVQNANHNNFQFDNLFFDLNGLIHPVCHGISNEDIMFERIKQYIINIIKITKPKLGVYLIMDGVAPYAKILQQRQRRFKSIDNKKNKNKFYTKYNIPITDKSEKNEWDTNAISPGTLFMQKLSTFLIKNFVKQNNSSNLKFYISDTNEVGEGEHKIIEMIIKKNLSIYHNCIYGMDADLILLCWSLYFRNEYYNDNNISNDIRTNFHKYRLTLIREKSNFFKMNNDFIYLYIPILVHCFIKTYNINDFVTTNIQSNFEYEIINQKSKQLCIDFIFLMTILGNDFLPNLFGIAIGSNGIENILNCYRICSNKNDYYHIIHVDCLKKIFIHWKNVYQFFNEIYSIYVNNILPKFYLDYINYKPKMKHIDTIFEEYVKEYNEIDTIFNKSDPLLINELTNNMISYEEFTINYYERYFNTESIFDTKFQDNIVNNYITGYYWIIEYYLKFNINNISFGYYYNYPVSPLPQLILSYLHRNKYNIDTKRYLEEPFVNIKPLTCNNALKIILPPESIHLIPNEILNKNDNYKLIYIKDYKIHISECYVIIIIR